MLRVIPRPLCPLLFTRQPPLRCAAKHRARRRPSNATPGTAEQIHLAQHRTVAAASRHFELPSSLGPLRIPCCWRWRAGAGRLRITGGGEGPGSHRGKAASAGEKEASDAATTHRVRKAGGEGVSRPDSPARQRGAGKS